MQQNGRGDILLQGRRTALLPVSTPMEAVAGQVDGDSDHVPVHMGVDAHIRAQSIHRRTPAGELPQLVDDGVFDLLCTEVAVTQRGARAGEVHGQRSVHGDVLGPGDPAYARVQLLRGGGLEALQGQKNPVGDPGPQTGTVGGLQSAAKAHPRMPRTQVGGAQPDQLPAQ